MVLQDMKKHTSMRKYNKRYRKQNHLKFAEQKGNIKLQSLQLCALREQQTSSFQQCRCLKSMNAFFIQTELQKPGSPKKVSQVLKDNLYLQFLNDTEELYTLSQNIFLHLVHIEFTLQTTILINEKPDNQAKRMTKQLIVK